MTWKSDAPLVLILALQLPVLLLVLIGSKCPIPTVVVVTPDGGVARTVPAYAPTPRMTVRRAQSHFDFITPPFRTRSPRRRGTHRVQRAARQAQPRGPKGRR